MFLYMNNSSKQKISNLASATLSQAVIILALILAAVIPVLPTSSRESDCRICAKRPKQNAFRCLGMAMMQKDPK